MVRRGGTSLRRPAVDVHASAMSAGDRLSGEQSQAKAIAATCIAPARTEWLENPRQDVPRNGPTVVNFHSDALLVPGGANLHRRPGCPVLHSVRDEIRDGLDDAVFIPGAYTINVAVECDPPIARKRPRSSDRREGS